MLQTQSTEKTSTVQWAMTAPAAASIESASRFGVVPNTGENAVPGIYNALQECRKKGITKLLFAPGRYDLWPDRAMEKYLFISNNDEGLKRIVFHLEGMKNFELDGCGARFVFHGPMVPFLVENSQGVALKNFSFDFSRPFHSEGRVLAVTPESADLEISEEFPYAIRHGVLVFTGKSKPAGPETTVSKGEVLYPYYSMLAFDPCKRETAFMAKDHYGLAQGIAAQEIGARKVRLNMQNISAKPGDILVFDPGTRLYPGIVITDSSDVSLSEVTIHNSGGMGVIAQRSADLFLNKVRVMPSPGGKRIVSTTADATHFVNCRGKIELVECLFEQQVDDATNIHGLYAKITRLLAPNRFEACLVHPQQEGVDFVKAGTRLELTAGPSLSPLGFAIAESVRSINKQYFIVETKGPLPDSVKPGDCIADADANTADVLIKNCVIRGNRARGILLGSRGKTVVEGNTFHTPGSAILFEGDASFWFEQAGVRDVVIRGNTFNNCNFGVWGKACIQVGSGIAAECRKTSRYNQNILVEDNLFRVFGPQPLLLIYSVNGLRFLGNRLERTHEYPAVATEDGGLFQITDSDRVDVENPTEIAP